MAEFDPSIISKIPDFAPNPLQAKKDAYTLASQMDEQAIHRLQLRDAQTQEKEEQKAKEIVKSSKNDTAEDRVKTAEKLRTEVGPEYSNKFLKEAQGIESGDYAIQMQKLQVAGAQQDAIVGAMDGVISQVDALKAAGATPAMLNAKTQELGTQAMRALVQARPDLAPAVAQFAQSQQAATYEGWKSAEAASKAGRDRIKTRLEEHRQETLDAAQKTRDRQADIAQQNADTKERDEKSKEKIRNSDTVDPEDALFMAKQYLAGDKSVLTGLGRGEKGAGNILSVRRAIREEAKVEGLTPNDVASRIAAFNGLMAEERAAGTRQATIAIASKEAENIFPIVEKAAKDVPRSNWVPINDIVQKLEKWKSDPKLGAFAQAIDTTVNVYARAISPTGVPHEAARARALQLLSTATGQQDFQAKIDVMKQEIQAAKDAPDAIRDEILDWYKKSLKPPSGVVGGASGAAQTPPLGGQALPPPAAGGQRPPGGGEPDLGGGIWHP